AAFAMKGSVQMQDSITSRRASSANLSKPANTSKDLPALARRINESHASAEAAVRQGLTHALEAGRLLADAKAVVAHGQWETWLDENFKGSRRTAQAYLAMRKSFAGLNPDAQHAALLEGSLRGAIRMLAGETDVGAGGEAKLDDVHQGVADDDEYESPEA